MKVRGVSSSIARVRPGPWSNALGGPGVGSILRNGRSDHLDGGCLTVSARAETSDGDRDAGGVRVWVRVRKEGGRERNAVGGGAGDGRLMPPARGC